MKRLTLGSKKQKSANRILCVGAHAACLYVACCSGPTVCLSVVGLRLSPVHLKDDQGSRLGEGLPVSWHLNSKSPTGWHPFGALQALDPGEN